MQNDTIARIRGREILNAKGRPTVEAEVSTAHGVVATASVPSGTSKGKYEAFELHDGGTRYAGHGTRTAARHVSEDIDAALVGQPIADPARLDRMLIDLDGTENKSRLGANAILAASVALHKAKALGDSAPLYRSLNPEKSSHAIPDIVATVIAGGAFSPSGLEFEDYMYVLSGFGAFGDELEALVLLRATLEKTLRQRYGDFPEDGGALAAPIDSTATAFEVMLDVVKTCGVEKQVTLGLDVAASEFYDETADSYAFGGGMNRDELCAYYGKLCARYPLTFIEDGFSEDDPDGFALLKDRQPGIQIVGDDLFVSNLTRLKRYADRANGLLLKINQIGTVTEAIAAADHARKTGLDTIVSLRSGETADDFIADLSVAVGARQIKLGSPVRMERNVKYNRLLRIADDLHL